MAMGENNGALLVWSKRNIFQLSAKIYVTFLQRKYRDYEIMLAPHILLAEIGNLCGESAAYLKKCDPRINMRPLAD